MKKTDRDVRREEIAHAINGDLVGTSIHVLAGGRRGPYTLAVERLNRDEMERAIRAVREALGR